MELLGAGLRSLAEVPEEAVSGPSLNLHLNRLSSLEGLSRLRHLRELILSSNGIAELRELDSLGGLRSLDLSCNAVRSLSGLGGLRSLRELRVAYNRLETLEGLQQLWGSDFKLQILDLRKNYVRELPQVLYLGGCTSLEKLWLCQDYQAKGSADAQSNPVCSQAGYRSCVLRAAPWLALLDDQQVATGELEPNAGGDARPAHVEELSNTGCKADPVSHTMSSSEKPAMSCSLEHTQCAPPKATSAHAALEHQLSDLNTQIAQMIDVLFRTQQASAGTAHRLHEEVLEEVSSLQVAASVEAQAVEEQRSASEQRARFQADLAEIAVEVQRREEHHQTIENELSSAAVSLSEAAAAQQSWAAALREESSSEEDLAARLHEQRGHARAASAEESTVHARVQRLEESAAEDATLGVRSLQLEFLRMSSALATAMQSLKAQREKSSDLVADLRRVEERLRARTDTQNKISMEVLSREKEVRSGGHEATEQIGMLSAVIAQCVQQGGKQTSEIAKERARAQACTASTLRRRADVASLEAELAKSALQAALQETLQSMDEEHRRSRIDRDEGVQRSRHLEQELRDLMGEARDLVASKRQELDASQLQLEKQRSALAAAGNQHRLGSYIRSELRLELEQEAHSESLDLSATKALVEQTAAEEEASARSQDRATAVQRESTGLRHLLETGCVGRSRLDACLARRRDADELLARQDRQLAETGADVTSRQSRLCAQHRELASLSASLARAHAEEEASAQSLKVQAQMATHAHEQMEQIKESVRRAAACQSERDSHCHGHLEEVVGATEDLNELASQLQLSSAELADEVDQLERSVAAKGQASEFAGLQLSGLQALQAEQDRVAAAQASHLREESQRVFHRAREAMVEIEEKFRTERGRQIEERAALREDLRAARRDLAAAPQTLRAARRRVEEEKARSAQRVAALLAGLTGSSPGLQPQPPPR